MVAERPLSQEPLSQPVETRQKIVLHVGCGFPNPNKLDPLFRGAEWRELRFDINPEVQPDLLGSMTDMSAVPSGSVDAVWSSHNREHLDAHDVPTALSEFHRVLRTGGWVLLTCPDLEAIAKLVLEVGPTGTAYASPAGPITPLDMMYGYGRSIARGNHYMAHRTGFTETSLCTAFVGAGFRVGRSAKGSNYDLWIKAIKDA